MEVTAPTRETMAMELRFGNCATRMAAQVKTKNHSAPVSAWALQVFPLSLSQSVLNNSFRVPPPVMISMTHVPPERYITGNSAATFPNLLPTKTCSNVTMLAICFFFLLTRWIPCNVLNENPRVFVCCLFQVWKACMVINENPRVFEETFVVFSKCEKLEW